MPQCYDRIIAGCRLAADALGCRLIEVEQLWTATDLPRLPDVDGLGVVFNSA